MNNAKDNENGWHFPPDLAALLAPSLFAVPFLILDPYVWRAESRGDPTLLIVALALAVVGIVMLFFARLPLYRQGRLFTLGPAPLDAARRRLYRWAYVFIIASAFLLGVLLLFLR